VRLVHLLAVLLVSASAAAVSLRTSAIAVTADGARVLAVNQDSNSISIIDSVARSKVSEIPVCTSPQTVALGAQEKLAYVVCRDGSFTEVDLDKGQVSRSPSVGVDPFGALAVNGRIFVTVSGESRIAVLDPASLSEVASIATAERPREWPTTPRAETSMSRTFVQDR
jgi:YVTN family beta-propeller protein